MKSRTPGSRWRLPNGSLPPLAGGATPTITDTDKSLKDSLRQVEEDLVAAREQRVDAVRKRDAARDAYASSGKLGQDSPEFKAARAAVAAVGEIDDRIDALQKSQVEILKVLGRDRPSEAVAAGHPPFAMGGSWKTAELLQDDILRGRLEQMGSSTMAVGRLGLGQVVDRDTLAADVMAADVTGTANMRRADYAGIVPQLRRPLRILDLLPTGTMDNNSLPYTQESGSFTTAGETAEGTLKPQGDIAFTDATADAATIAHWVKVRKQVLADFPALQSMIDGRLHYGVLRRLEDEIVAGNGTAPNIRGILATTGIGAVAYAAGELVADQILAAITNVFLADGEANAIVMHPLDWRDALKAKAAGDGHYFSEGPFSVTPTVMWGVPLIPSRAIPQGGPLVGDFALGAQLFIREGVNVLLSDSDQDDFVNNRVTLLAEMRAALAVYQPALFTTVDLTP
jgi:HK97 family phage major capsid protein